MKIIAVETYARPVVTLVRVRADDGLEGWGQTAPYNADITAQVLHRQVAPHVLGREEADTSGLSCSVMER